MSYKRIPSRDLVQSCALEHGIPFEDLNSCVSEEGKGLDLLEASIKRSEEAGVKKSCTVSAHLCINKLSLHPLFSATKYVLQAVGGLQPSKSIHDLPTAPQRSDTDFEICRSGLEKKYGA